MATKVPSKSKRQVNDVVSRGSLRRLFFFFTSTRVVQRDGVKDSILKLKRYTILVWKTRSVELVALT